MSTILPVWAVRLQMACRAVATDGTEIEFRNLADVRDRAEEFWQQQAVDRPMSDLNVAYFAALRSRLAPETLASHKELDSAWGEAWDTAVNAAKQPEVPPEPVVEPAPDVYVEPEAHTDPAEHVDDAPVEEAH